MIRSRAIGVLFVLGLWLSLAHAVAAQGVAQFAVQGQLIDSRTNMAAPGLTVSLVHPQFGRSAPSYSNGVGGFGWNAIPASPQAYLLEVYWGTNLIFRQPLLVNGPVFLGQIRL